MNGSECRSMRSLWDSSLSLRTKARFRRVRLLAASESWQEYLCIAVVIFLGVRRRAASRLRRRDIDLDRRGGKHEPPVGIPWAGHRCDWERDSREDDEEERPHPRGYPSGTVPALPPALSHLRARVAHAPQPLDDHLSLSATPNIGQRPQMPRRRRVPRQSCQRHSDRPNTPLLALEAKDRG